MLLSTVFLVVLSLVVVDTFADEPLELSGGFTSIGQCGGWPSFVTLKDGTIVAVRSDEARTSTDGGRTWDGPRRFCVHPQMGIVSIIRLNSGKLGAVVSRVEGIPNLGRDKENFRKMTLAFSTSADEGATWSDLVQMNRYHTHGTPHVDTLIQTRTGRLILPVRTGFTAIQKVISSAGAYGLVNGERRLVG